MIDEVISPLTAEIAVFLLAVVVLMLGLVAGDVARTDAARAGAARTLSGPRIGWVAFIGLLAVFGLTFGAAEGQSLFGGTYVEDGLSLFSKRLFIAAAALSVLGSLTLGQRAFERRAGEYYFALLASLLGMMVLASARELVLLFVAFELMSIPLFVLSGFLKRDTAASEAALKFFLVGTASSAVVLFGLSFVFGVTGTTDISAIPAVIARGDALAMLGMALLLAGLGFKIAAFPFHMWAPDTYEAASTPFVAWLSVAPKAAGFIVIVRLFLEGVGPAALVWLPAVSALAGITIVTGNLMAIPQQNIKRLLAYSGIAHIGYMLVGIAALSASGVGMVLFYLVAYLFGNMGAFLVVEAVSRAEQSDGIDAYRGLAQRSPLLALAMLLFLLSLGGIPFVAGFWAKLYVFVVAIERGLYVLVFVGAVLTVVALYYYLLVARRMYIEPSPRVEPVPVPGPLAVAIGVCVLGVVGMGIFPGPWVAETARVADALFR
jgi:NADH-quinone oxidoreductase subunit N